MPRIHGLRYKRRLNAFDAFAIAPAQRGVEPAALATHKHLRIFGNRNLGYRHLTNLQVPATLASDQTAAINHWYARTDVLPEALTERQRASLHRVAAMTVVTLRMGDQPQWTASLADLLAERPWEPATITAERETPEAMAAIRARFDRLCAEGARPLVVPVRQCISVEVDSSAAPVNALVQDLDGIPMMIWVHLEGISSRDVG